MSTNLIEGYWWVVLVAGTVLGFAVKRALGRDIRVLILTGAFFVCLGLVAAISLGYSSSDVIGILVLADVDGQDRWGLSRPMAFGYILLIAGLILGLRKMGSAPR